MEDHQTDDRRLSLEGASASLKKASAHLQRCTRMVKQRFFKPIQFESESSCDPPPLIVTAGLYRLTRVGNVLEELSEKFELLATWMDGQLEPSDLADDVGNANGWVSEPYLLVAGESLKTAEMLDRWNSERLSGNDPTVITIDALVSGLHVSAEHILEILFRWLKCHTGVTGQTPFCMDDLYGIESQLPMRYPEQYEEAKSNFSVDTASCSLK